MIPGLLDCASVVAGSMNMGERKSQVAGNGFTSVRRTGKVSLNSNLSQDGGLHDRGTPGIHPAGTG